MEKNDVLLKTEDIHTYLGEGHILQGVSLEIEKGSITALLGRNGVGKSTTLKSIMGLTPPRAGSIRYKGQEITHLRTYKVSRLGIGYVPEERRIFGNLTVRENLLLGMRSSGNHDGSWTIERMYDYFPRLKERDRQKGGTMSGGEQQMLTLCRTIMGNPDLLLVDEPTEGLSPAMVDMVVEVLGRLNEKGRTILLVEHTFDVALELAARAYVMSKGTIVFSGTSGELRANEDLRRKYLEA